MSQTATFDIPALDCPDELALIERGLRHVEGIDRIAPDYLQRKLRVEFDPNRTTPSTIVNSISAAGFPATMALPVAVAATSSAPAAPVSINATMAVGGILLLAAAVLQLAQGKTTWPVAALAIASAIASGTRVVAAAWRAIKLRALDMNALMAIAATGAIAIGDYFEAATAMFLFAVSLWLEKLSLARAQRAIRSLVALTPTIAHRLSTDAAGNETIEDIDPTALAVGQQVLIRPGERIPTDGEVLTGQSAVNQAPITGESAPVEKQTGDRVFAGSLNGEGALTVTVARTAGDTTLAHIARLVDEARAARSPTERFVDAFARRYTPAIILLALLTMFVPPLLASLGIEWAAAHTTADWVQRGLVLLVIACPCALVISTPVTIVSGLHQATRNGILVKGGEFLEKAASIRAVALDKTGTVTTGQMQVTSVETFNGRSTGEVLSIAAALERHSEHPLAAAILAAADQQQLTTNAAQSVTALRGFGVQGEINGNTFYLGNSRLFQQPQFSLSQADTSRLQSAASNSSSKASAETTAWLATNNHLLGVIKLADQSRPGAREAIADLRSLGVNRIAMLTGDNRQAAENIAHELGIEELYAELLPQDKIDRVKSMREAAALAMVGDGVNDAPALAAANVGIALGGQSSDTAMETADVVIMAPELSKVATLIRLSRRCRMLLKQNIAFALGTKLLVMALAVAGIASMWMAIAADVGASMLVIANGMRIINRNGIMLTTATEAQRKAQRKAERNSLMQADRSLQ